MADPATPAPEDPFAQIDPGMTAASARAAPVGADAPAAPSAPVANDNNEPANPFADLGPEAGPGQSGAVGSFARGAEKGALPAAGTLAGAGFGAELGSAAGLPLAPFTAGWSVPVLGTVGGLVGGFGGGAAVQGAQNWALKHLPDSWSDGIGFSDRQTRLDEAQHSGASFLGGLAPYAVTMSPNLAFRGAAKDLPENATALQRILAHPATAKLFGGALMGGMEAGNEKLSGEDLNWRKTAVATVFGTIFNKPNGLGEAITEAGAHPTRTILGRPHPTLAQAADLKVMGPGITESVFQGTQEHAPDAAMTAQENARVEAAALGEGPEPDLHAIAAKMEPETFQHYEELLKQRDTLAAWHGEGANAEVAEKHLAATETQIRQLSPEIAAAYRRARDTVGTGEVEAEPFPSLAHMLAAHESGTGAVSHETDLPEMRGPGLDAGTGAVLPAVQAGPLGDIQPNGGETPGIGPAGVAQPAPVGLPRPQRTIGEQRAFIADDVTQKLIAAGRPAEEAQAAGHLIAARYVTRAGRFEGKLGSAEELYAREGAAIAGPNERPQAPAIAPQEPVRPSPSAASAQVPEEAQAVHSEPEKELFQRDQVQTPEFKNWFGESKAVDADGKPKVFYHGTTSEFDRFGNVQGGNQYGHGYYFTDSAESGSRYATGDVNRISPQGNAGANVVPVYLKYDKPFERRGTIARDDLKALERAANEMDPGHWKPGELAKQFDRAYPPNGDNVAYQLGPKANEIIRKAGFDAMVEPHMTVVFEPTQIKSAIANRGTFDPNDPRILNQTARGKIRISEGQRPIITLMKDANASTFMHESGHQFLEELMRDADHPDAPPQLRDDAQTVRDWLGVTDDIKTKHHEKFARGFEQYLREGVAPSKELAGVFAKFRNWLLQIYQSLKGLGTEISPDIRGVFDRMLEMEPQRTIISPHERPGEGLSLHEIHTADAEHTEPHEAAAVFDRTKAEFDRYIAEPPPDIAHEINPVAEKVEQENAARAAGTDPGAEAVGGASPAPEVVGGSGGPESKPEGGGLGAGRGGIERGAGQPAAEGPELQRPDPRSKLGDNPGTALAPGPADLFGNTDSGLIDKAGNIVLKNLNSPEEVLQAFRESAGRNNDFIGDRRGVVTPGQVMDLARQLGMEGAQDIVDGWVKGRALNAEQIVAVRLLARESATSVHMAYARAAASGAEADIIAQAQAEARHDMIQGVLSGATAEWGRAGSAFKMLKDDAGGKTASQLIQEATGKTLFQAMQRAKLGAELKTPEQVAKFMNDAKKRNFASIVLEYWINGLISGPATHMTYMAGNTLSAIMKLPETAAAAGAGRVASALGREGSGVRLGEVGAMVRGAAIGIAPALKAGIEAARTGVTTALPGEGPEQTALPFQPGSELAQPAQLDEAASFHQAMSAAYGLVQGMKDTVISHAALIAAGGVPGESLFSRQWSPNRSTPDIAFRGVTVLPTGAIATLPSRGVAVIHSFFRSLVFSMEKNAMAYRRAAEEGLAGAELHARVAQIRSDPSETMMNELAAHEATETALMGKGSELTQRLAALTNTPIFGAPLLKFIDPFVRVSGNIIDQSLIRRTPVGLLTMLGPETELARDLTGKNGNVAQDKAIGRMMVGTALAVTFGSLAAQKMISGSGPKDPKEANIWRMAGNQPHSVRIGDTWYQVNKLGPMGMLASLSADLYDVAHEAEQGEFTKAGAHLLHAITQNVLDESAMHGPAELLKAIETPDRYGESYIRNYLAAFVPFSVGMGQIGRAQDPYQRDVRTMVDAIRNKIPGHLDNYFGHELPVRRDIWGEPLPSRTALGGAAISAIYEQKINADPVNQAMFKVGVFPGSVERKIHNVDLTADQYADFQRLSGRMAKMRLDKMVISPQFIGQTPSVQHDWMTEVIKQSRESARQMMMIKNPEIIRKSLEAKQAKKQAINDREAE